MLREMVERLEAEKATRDELPVLHREEAPVSGVKSLMDYEVTLQRRAHEGQAELHHEVVVPGDEPVPLLQGISERGAHNQRSHVTSRPTRLRLDRGRSSTGREAGSSELYGLPQAPHEKHVTERATTNPKSSRTCARRRRRAQPGRAIEAYVVESENFESIHNHNAYRASSRKE